MTFSMSMYSVMGENRARLYVGVDEHGHRGDSRGSSTSDSLALDFAKAQGKSLNFGPQNSVF